MSLSRREFALVAGPMALALLSGVGLRAGNATPRLTRRLEDTWFEWKEVGEGAWTALGEGGNVLVLASGGESLIVDAKNAGFGDVLRREAGTRAAQTKLVRVINTHHHADHTGGNYAFRPDIPITAQAKATARIAAQVERYRERIKGAGAQIAKSEKAGAKAVLADVEALSGKLDALTPERFAPTDVIEKEGELKVGSRRVEVQHFGPGHTDNDLVVRIPELNLIHAGDLIFNRRHPVMDVPGGAASPQWLDCLFKVVQLCNEKTVVIPGHGDITDLAGVQAQARYFRTVHEAVRKAIVEGKTREEITKLPLDEFKDYGAPQSRTMVLGAVYDEFKSRPGAK